MEPGLHGSLAKDDEKGELKRANSVHTVEIILQKKINGLLVSSKCLSISWNGIFTAGSKASRGETF